RLLRLFFFSLSPFPTVNRFFSDQIQSKSALRERSILVLRLCGRACVAGEAKLPSDPIAESEPNRSERNRDRSYSVISELQNIRLYIKQATSATSVADEEEEEAEWVEYKIKETNMFTVDKYQQSADWILPQGESLFIEVSNRWNVGYHLRVRRSRRR
uniref:Uncharacterized protein n=1 Tax=Brassica oleracea var. oleracea TaxID=109376 RepID=A0A0D3A2K2_BRAOL